MGNATSDEIRAEKFQKTCFSLDCKILPTCVEFQRSDGTIEKGHIDWKTSTFFLYKRTSFGDRVRNEDGTITRFVWRLVRVVSESLERDGKHKWIPLDVIAEMNPELVDTILSMKQELPLFGDFTFDELYGPDKTHTKGNDELIEAASLKSKEELDDDFRKFIIKFY